MEPQTGLGREPTLPRDRRRCDRPPPAIRGGGGTARGSDRRRRRTAAGHGPGSCARIVCSSPGRLRDRASHIWIGGGSSSARCSSTWARFSPACRRPLKNRATRWPSCKRDHARGVQAPPLVGVARVARGTGQGLLPGSFSHQLQDLDRGVIVVQHLALRRLPDQLIERRSEARRHRLHDVPLGRGRQRDAQVPLQAIEAVERQSAAVLQEPDHAAGRGVVLPVAGPLGRRCGEDLAAQVAAQLLQLVDLRRQRAAAR